MELDVKPDDILVTTCTLELKAAGEVRSVFLKGNCGTPKEMIGLG